GRKVLCRIGLGLFGLIVGPYALGLLRQSKCHASRQAEYEEPHIARLSCRTSSHFSTKVPYTTRPDHNMSETAMHAPRKSVVRWTEMLLKAKTSSSEPAQNEGGGEQSRHVWQGTAGPDRKLISLCMASMAQPVGRNLARVCIQAGVISIGHQQPPS